MLCKLNFLFVGNIIGMQIIYVKCIKVLKQVFEFSYAIDLIIVVWNTLFIFFIIKHNSHVFLACDFSLNVFFFILEVIIIYAEFIVAPV